MKVTVKTATLVVAAVLAGTAGAEWTAPTVSNVTLTQRENSRFVDIGYTLADANAIVTLSIETNGASIPDPAVTRLSGDVCRVVQTGSRSIVWNAGADWPEQTVTNARARVTAWHTNSPPLYCVVDLSAGYNTNRYPVTYYASAEALPDGGLTNDLYRTVRLVMRRIRTGAPFPEDGVFMMGSQVGEIGRATGTVPEDYHQVTLTNDFYVGVYEVTQGQWLQVMNLTPSSYKHADYWKTRPVEYVAYNDVRGIGWPATTAVAANTFIDYMRAKTGIAGFDLPTEAQWEYACRAGTDLALNVPLSSGSNLTDKDTDTNMGLAGRYERNGGRILDGTWKNPETVLGITTAQVTTNYATAKVGTYRPNAWGLYDMHGNVWEWCRDFYVGALGTGAVIDPPGAASGDRAMRGGGWISTAGACRSATRSSYSPTSKYNFLGFRCVQTLP